MQVAEERHEAAVGGAIHQHAHLGGLGHALGRGRIALLVEGAEILAVDEGVRCVLARQHGVGLGARRHQDGARRQGRLYFLAVLVPCHLERLGVAVGIDLDRDRRQALGEADVLLQRLQHLFVVQRIGRQIDQAPPIGDGDAAPAVHQAGDVRRAAFAFGGHALGADGFGMGNEFAGDLALFGVHGGEHRGKPTLLDQNLVSRQKLLDLQWIVGEQFGRRIDRRQAAADHHHRQADLQVGDGVLLGGTRELQRHQEVRRRAHAARQAVGQVEHGGLAGAGAQRHVVEAHGEGILDRHRAAEAHAAEHRELAAPLEQQAHHLQVVLVPAHRDAVLGNAAEARHGALAEVLAYRGCVTHRREGMARAIGRHAGLLDRQRLDLQSIDADHGMAVIHQVMRQIEARRAQPHHEHGAAGRGPGSGRRRFSGFQRVSRE